MNLWIFLVSFSLSLLFVLCFTLSLILSVSPGSFFVFTFEIQVHTHMQAHTRRTLFSHFSHANTHKTFIFVLISFGSLDFDYLSC